VAIKRTEHIAGIVVNSAFKVHKSFELIYWKVYEVCLAQISKMDLDVKGQVNIPIVYDSIESEAYDWTY
jgi:hypothetical protein